MKIQTFSMTADSNAPTCDATLAGESTLVLAFGDPAIERVRGAFARLVACCPGATVIGCSTAGEIVGESVVDGTLSGAIARFERSTLRSASVRVDGAPASFAAGQDLGAQLAGERLRAVFVLSEGLNVNGSELVRGLNATLGPGVVVTGGLAADGDRFGSTWVYAGGEFHRGLVAAVGLYGDLEVGHGSVGGWDIFGPERTVTASQANVLYAIDGRPALLLYKEYLGDLADGLPGTALLFPLSVRTGPGEDAAVRTILAVDEGAQSLTFAGDVPLGSRVQLMRANFDRLVDGAAAASGSAIRLAPATGPVLSIAISCVGRRLVLGQRVEEELEATLATLPEGAAQVGFYSYGELSPLASGRCELHNQTMTVTTFWERAA